MQFAELRNFLITEYSVSGRPLVITKAFAPKQVIVARPLYTMNWHICSTDNRQGLNAQISHSWYYERTVQERPEAVKYRVCYSD